MFIDHDAMYDDDAPCATAYITAVEVYRIQQKRFIAVADSTGTVAVYKDGGTKLHAVFRATSPVVVFKQSTHSVAWLTEDSVGAADPNTLELRTVGCQHLNGRFRSHSPFRCTPFSFFKAAAAAAAAAAGIEAGSVRVFSLLAAFAAAAAAAAAAAS